MKHKVAISVIVTVLNEEKTIQRLLDALAHQTYPIAEVIIVDALSSDRTADLIRTFCAKYPHFHLKLIEQAGNRSIGRNLAVTEAKSPWLAITDAGCVPKRNWVEKLVERLHEVEPELKKSSEGVIAGFYYGMPKTPFEEAVVPYVLVMPDRANPETFLPATRSMLISKKVWQKLGGLNPHYEVSEDFEFAHRIQAARIPIFFAKDAQVGWIPRSNLKQFINMIKAFAQGDIRAGIVRKKVLFLFARYVAAILLITLAVLNQMLWLWLLILGAAVLYAGWSIVKNQKYVPRGWYYLPLLQVVADLAVMSGTLRGTWQRMRQ